MNSLWIFIFETDKAPVNNASSKEKGDWRDICIKQINKIHIKFKIKIKSFKHIAVDDQIKAYLIEPLSCRYNMVRWWFDESPNDTVL